MAFLDKAERKFEKMGPLGADIDAVKKQIEQLKNFKAEVDPHMVKVEALNRSVIFRVSLSHVDTVFLYRLVKCYLLLLLVVFIW